PVLAALVLPPHQSSPPTHGGSTRDSRSSTHPTESSWHPPCIYHRNDSVTQIGGTPARSVSGGETARSPRRRNLVIQSASRRLPGAPPPHPTRRGQSQLQLVLRPPALHRPRHHSSLRAATSPPAGCRC